uniref:phospholipase D n=1 Tax=Astyanax mexicanus TaxID=7994 RepID=A0A8B9HTC7_ASTMX
MANPEANGDNQWFHSSHCERCLSEDQLDAIRNNSGGCWFDVYVFVTDVREFFVVHHLDDLREGDVSPLLHNTPITCKVENSERYTTRSKVRVCTLYTVRLTHGEFTWTVKRKYKHFQELQRDLYKHKMMLQLLHLGRFAIHRQQLDNMGEEMPSLHGTERMRRTSSKPKYLEEYLNSLLENTFCKNYCGMVMRHPDHVASVVFLWAHHEKMVAIDQSVAFVGGLDLAFGRWDDSSYRLVDVASSKTANHNPRPVEDGSTVPLSGGDPREAPGGRDEVDLSCNALLWLGKDYSNFIKRDWTQLDQPFQDNVDRTQVPRIPWRDLGAVLHGKAARDLARHFIQRWNFTKIFKTKYKDKFYPYLLPKSHTTADTLPFTVPGTSKASVQVCHTAHTHRQSDSAHCMPIISHTHTEFNRAHYNNCSNQFFISCADERSVHNTIGDAIVKRILRAHSEKKKYRVFVVVPLLPGFEGDIAEGGGRAIQAILHFTYRTMNRGECSILSRLKEQMQDEWTQYISLCGVRTHSVLGPTPITELIYVHSKALIADDRCYIIGSANINDRSMLGSRDSELAVLVEDEERVPSRMNGEDYEAGPLALALRKECFRVLLGADSDPSIDIDDPVSDDFFNNVWNKTAQSNAFIYEMVFRCLPLDSIRNMRELQEHVSVHNLAQMDPEKASRELQAIRGILVHFPLHFLCEEILLPPPGTKERMVPLEVWT